MSTSSGFVILVLMGKELQIFVYKFQSVRWDFMSIVGAICCYFKYDWWFEERSSIVLIVCLNGMLVRNDPRLKVCI